MSTSYYIPAPATIAQVRMLTGWKPWADENGEGITDGKDFIHAAEVAWNGNLYVAFERFGGNDIEPLLKLLRSVGFSVVSEHDDDWNPPWYAAED